MEFHEAICKCGAKLFPGQKNCLECLYEKQAHKEEKHWRKNAIRIDRRVLS